jgi:hypothetical protein
MIISPDGRWLGAANNDGCVRLWSLSLEEILNLARRTANRELTAEERTQYLLDEK